MTQAAASSSRNGLFVPMPSREEAEELERVLAVAESATMGGVGHAESDLSDLSLIDDHTLALAHDLITLGAGASAQSMMIGNEVAAVSNHLYMDNLSIPHQTIHPGNFRLVVHNRLFIWTIFFFTSWIRVCRRLYNRRSLFFYTHAVQKKEPIDDSCWAASKSCQGL